MIQRRTVLKLPLAALAAGGVPAAQAQTFPSQPVHIVVPFPPGGGTDALARAIQEPMQKALGGTGAGTVIVDNKGGGGGSIAHEFVAKQPADGHWMVVSANNLPLYPHIVAKLGFDAKTAFVPIGFIAKQESVLVGSLDAPWPDLKAIIAAAKAAPGSVQYGTAGLTTPMHLSTEQFAMLNGIKLTHVPFRGTGPLVTDLLGGHIKLGMSSITSVAPQIAAGKLKPYAMASLERSSVAPHDSDLQGTGCGRCRRHDRLHAACAGRHSAGRHRQVERGAERRRGHARAEGGPRKARLRRHGRHAAAAGGLAQGTGADLGAGAAGCRYQARIAEAPRRASPDQS
jgi:tripartite-type tricarboxylate transporter receptor subunit TctC